MSERLWLKDNIMHYLKFDNMDGLKNFVEEQGEEKIIDFLCGWQDGIMYKRLVAEPQTLHGIQYKDEHFSLLETCPIVRVLEVMGYADYEDYPKKLQASLAQAQRVAVEIMNYYEPEIVIDGAEGGLKLDQNASPAEAAAERG